VSGQHAYIRGERDGQHRLFDGSPAGKPSANGTYVNYQPVPPGGTLLQDGDLLILAAQERNNPRAGVPGTAAFIYSKDCPDGTP
jgi:pSer/pThr/pTyr-binding forkhead associated (FHA) protein